MSAMSELHAQISEIATRDNAAAARHSDTQAAHRAGVLTAAEIIATVAEFMDDDAADDFWFAHDALMAMMPEMVGVTVNKTAGPAHDQSLDNGSAIDYTDSIHQKALTMGKLSDSFKKQIEDMKTRHAVEQASIAEAREALLQCIAEMDRIARDMEEV